VARGKRETFWTIAAKYQVPVEKIIEFNFPGSVEKGRVIPAITNWYLHHHKGFGCPETHDHINRKFMGGERVAIPLLGHVEIGDVVIRKPISLDDPERPDLVASEKFIYEFKIPPKAPADLGYLLAQARISVEGEILKEKGLAKFSFKKDQIKASLEKKFDTDFKGTFSVKVDDKTMATIAEELKKGSKAGFARALFAPFEASLKQSYRFGNIAVTPELGGEFSITPVVVRLAGEYQDTLIVEGMSLKGKFVVKIGFNVGLSKKGWAWVAQKVGPEAIKRFISGAGRALAGLWEYLVAEGVVAAGVIVIGTVAGTLALTYLMAWVVADARHKGELEGLSSWYVSAFWRKVFGDSSPSGPMDGDAKVRDELVRLGEQDAVAEARSVLRKAQRPEADGTDREALDAYKNILIDLDKGNYNWARDRLQNSVREHARKLVGL
jgi:hypothetical protein